MNRSIYMTLATVLALSTANAYAVPYSTSSDTADITLAIVTSAGGGSGPNGTLYFPHASNLNRLIIGRAGSNPTYNGNGILFFELPDNVQTVDSSSLSFFFDLSDGANTSEGVDLWGIGYQGNTTVDTAWFSTTESDAGAGVGIPSRVKVQDDIIVGTNPTGTYTTTGTTLTNYLQSLYDAGAEGGDYAIFRLNTDFNAGVSSNSRFSIYSGDELTQPQPLLQLDFTEVPPVPEPSTGILVPGALVLFGLRRKMKRRKQGRQA